MGPLENNGQGMISDAAESFWECEVTPTTLYLDAAATRGAALLFPFKEKAKG